MRAIPMAACFSRIANFRDIPSAANLTPLLACFFLLDGACTHPQGMVQPRALYNSYRPTPNGLGSTH